MSYRAYYYSLDATGEASIDEILSAVARAGKAFHHTMSWTDPDLDGQPPIEKIQQAANEAAQQVGELRAALKELKSWALDCGADASHRDMIDRAAKALGEPT